MVIFNETSVPQMRPTFDRSPTNIRRSLSNSPNSNLNKNNNNNNNNNTHNNNGNSSNNNGAQNNANNTTNNNNTNLSQNVTAKTTDFTHINRTKTDYLIQRNALSSSVFSKRSINANETPATKSIAEINKVTADLAKLRANAHTNASLTQTTPTPTTTSTFTRSKQQPLTNLELKPATVEVYFRSSSGKTQRIERKAIPTTIFPPPKINLKA